jgi:hypothetical protein
MATIPKPVVPACDWRENDPLLTPQQVAKRLNTSLIGFGITHQERCRSYPSYVLAMARDEQQGQRDRDITSAIRIKR